MPDEGLLSIQHFLSAKFGIRSTVTEDKVHFRCPNCDRKLRISVAHSGKRVRCPRCDTSVLVPEPEPEPALAPPSPREQAHGDDHGVTDLYPARSVEENVEGWIDMTAMVDIVFFLLIFFMVTSLNVQQSAIEMPVPQVESSTAQGARGARTAEQLDADPNSVVVRIDEDNAVFIENEEVLALVELPGRLRDATQPTQPGGEQKKIMVLASGDAQHGTAVTVLDSAREGGVTGVSMAVEEDE
jgi:biopolymer transport protein ExbD